MAERIHTDIEALYDIKEAILKFSENIQISRSDFVNCFGEMEYQITTYYAELQEAEEELTSQINQACSQYEDEKKASEQCREGRTDSFCCRKCGGHIMLKIMTDETQCREAGCDGIAVRVYNNTEYQQHIHKMEQIKHQVDDMRQKVQRINQESTELELLKRKFEYGKEKILELLVPDADVSADSVIAYIDKAIGNVGDYHSITIESDDCENVKKRHDRRDWCCR